MTMTPREQLAEKLRLALAEVRPGLWLHIEKAPWADLPHERKTKWLHLAATAEATIAERGPEYPRQSPLEDAAGPFTEIGPECFVTADGRELSYKGENYIRQAGVIEVIDMLVAEGHDDFVTELREVAYPPAVKPVTRARKAKP